MKVFLTKTIAALVLLCSIDGKVAVAQTKERAKLIEDARKEGKVMVYVS